MIRYGINAVKGGETVAKLGLNAVKNAINQLLIMSMLLDGLQIKNVLTFALKR